MARQVSLAALGRVACRAVMSESSSSLAGETVSSLHMALRGLAHCHASSCNPVEANPASTAGSATSSPHVRQLALRSSAPSAPTNPSPPLGSQPAWGHRCFSTSHIAAAGASEAGGGSRVQGGGQKPYDQEQPQEQPPQQAATSAAAPVQNPLQAALAAAAAAEDAAVGTAAGGAGRVGTGGRSGARNWMWYDEEDEREERRKERRREQHRDVGTAYLMQVPQSMKKVDRIMKLVRGLSYPEALAQCQLVPHKAAGYVMQALEEAHKDATENKGLNGDRLVVGLVYVTKGTYDKGIQPMGMGKTGRLVTRKSHIRVVLREVPAGGGARASPLTLRGDITGRSLALGGSGADGGNGPHQHQQQHHRLLLGSLNPRQVPPLMAAWSARGVQQGGQRRQRFAYRTEV